MNAAFWFTPTQAFLVLGGILLMITVLTLVTVIMNRFATGDDDADLSDIY